MNRERCPRSIADQPQPRRRRGLPVATRLAPAILAAVLGAVAVAGALCQPAWTAEAKNPPATERPDTGAPQPRPPMAAQKTAAEPEVAARRIQAAHLQRASRLGEWLVAVGVLGLVSVLGSLVWMWLMRVQVKKRTAALEESEARVKAQFANSPIPIFCWKRTKDDYILVDLNEAAKQLYDGRTQRNIGARVSDVMPTWSEGRALIDQCFRERRTLRHVGKRPVALAGVERWKAATFVFLPPDMVLAHSEDITEQKETEIALRESEERYRQLVQHSVDGIVVRDEKNYLFANDAAARVMGMESADELIGTSWLDRVPPERREESISLFQTRLESRVPSEINERRMVRQDGTTIDVQVWATRIEWKGRPALLGMLRDISENKRTELALRESEQRYRDLIALSLDGVIVRDEENYLFANDAAARIFGCDSAEELMGKSWLDFVLPERVETARARFQEMLAEDARHELVARTWLRIDGSSVDVETWAKPIEWQGRRVLLGMIRDVSERARRERELRELTESLLHSQEETRRAQEELVRNERLALLGQLSASMSHELRNPLGVIGTGLSVIEMKLRDSDLGLDRALARMKRSVARCDRIIAEMLDYARDRALITEKTDVNAWLNALLDELELPETIVLRRELGELSGPVEIDPELLRRAVINLVENARDALMPQDRVGSAPAEDPKVLTVRTEMENGRTTIAVNDNGHGMSEEMVRSAFEPLFSTKAFGVGLGLAIVKKIVERHQGEIAIESAPGEGTRVTLTLPMRHAAAAMAGAAE